MPHRQYFKKINLLTNPEIQAVIPTICPARGYYDPNLPLPYIPDAAIPEITPNDGEIVLFMSTMWDAAINCTTTRTGTTGQIRYAVYGADDTQIYTQDVNSNTAFYYEFPSSGGILLASGYYGFKVVVKVATVEALNTFKFSTKSGYAANGWPVIEAHIKAPTLTSLDSALLTQKALKYVKFYGNHNSLTSCANFCSSATGLVECQMNVEMNALTSLASAFLNTEKLDVLTLPANLDSITTIYQMLANSGLKASPPLPNSLPACTTAQTAFNGMKRMAGTLYIPAMPACLNLTNIASNLPLVSKVIFRGSYIPNTGAAAMSACNGCDMLEEIDMSTGSWGTVGVPWNITYIASLCPSLKVIKLPTAIIAHVMPTSTLTLAQTVNASVTEITTCDFSQSQGLNSTWNFSKVVVFNQPTLNCKSATFVFQGASSRPYLLSSLELDWVNCVPLTAACYINCLYCNFSQAELERIYTALPDISTGYSYTGTLKFFGSPGYTASNKTIATAKGWVFATS